MRASENAKMSRAARLWIAACFACSVAGADVVAQSSDGSAAPERIYPSGKRITVTGIATKKDIVLPDHVNLPAGKTQIVELPEVISEVIVGEPGIVDVSVTSRRRLTLIGRKVGETNVLALNDKGEEIDRIEISVGPDANVIRSAMVRAFPDLHLTVSAEGSSLILSGTLQSDGDVGRVAKFARQYVEKDEQLVNLLRVAREQQVLLQVRVAEVQRRALKELGTELQVNNNPMRKMNEVSISGNTSQLGLNPLNQFAATFTLEGIRDLFVTLNMLEERGLVRSLAEPNLVAVSGETAAMLAGGEIPIPVPQQDGIAIEYKPFGVSLSFLPVILDSGRISLRLSTEVSALSADRIDVPLPSGPARISAFTVRRARSTVELPTGGSLMIAGLLQNDIVSGMNGIPGLMDTPILGQLFRSKSFRRNESELVIIVTATLVRPTAPQTMVAATDTLSPSTDIDNWVYARLLRRFTPGFVRDTQAGERTPITFGFTIDEAKP